MCFNPSEGSRDRDDRRPQGASLSLHAAVFKSFPMAGTAEIAPRAWNRRRIVPQRRHSATETLDLWI
jgi:hypothetical protein